MFHSPKKDCPCSKIVKTLKIEVTYLALVDPFCQSSINIYLKYHTNSRGLLPMELYTIKNYSLGKFVTSNFSFFFCNKLCDTETKVKIKGGKFLQKLGQVFLQGNFDWFHQLILIM